MENAEMAILAHGGLRTDGSMRTCTHAGKFKWAFLPIVSAADLLYS
jgi:hypothetical protein